VLGVLGALGIVVVVVDVDIETSHDRYTTTSRYLSSQQPSSQTAVALTTPH